MLWLSKVIKVVWIAIILNNPIARCLEKNTQNIPDHLCIDLPYMDRIEDASGLYSYDESKYQWSDDDYHTNIVGVRNSTWIIYYRSLDGIMTTCKSLPSDINPPDGTNVGDPSTCLQWDINHASISNDSADCAQFDLSLSFSDWCIIIYSCILFIILCVLMCPFPCNKYNKRHCQSNVYPSTKLETYEQIVAIHSNNNINNTHCDDNEYLSKLCLSHDLKVNKMVWENDYLKDFLIYLRFNHTFLSLFYNHKLHPYTTGKRWITFISLQFMAFGIGTWAAGITAEINLTSGIAQFLSEYALNWMLGLTLTLLRFVFDQASNKNKIPENFRRKNKNCCKECFLQIVDCFCNLTMIALCLACVTIGVSLVAVVEDNLNQEYPTVDRGAVSLVFSINYLAGLVLSWFCIDIVFMRLEFKQRWYFENGMIPEKSSFENQLDKNCVCCGRDELCSDHINKCCILSSLFCCCPCYRCCCAQTCKKKDPKVELMEYQRDANGTIIGNNKNLYAVLWQDYDDFISNKPIQPRNLQNIVYNKKQSQNQDQQNDLEVGLLKGT